MEIKFTLWDSTTTGEKDKNGKWVDTISRGKWYMFICLACGAKINYDKETMLEPIVVKGKKRFAIPFDEENHYIHNTEECQNFFLLKAI